MDMRQTSAWGKYLTAIGWKSVFLDHRLILVRKIPLLGGTFIKIQRPQNPIPFQKIDELAKTEKAYCVLIEPEIAKFSREDFIDHGFKESTMPLTHTKTMQINLNQPLNDLWKNFSENARRNIKKAQDHDLKIQRLSVSGQFDPKVGETYFRLAKSLMDLKKFYMPGLSETQKKLEALKDTTTILFAYTLGESEPIASVWLTGHGPFISYVQTGITQKGYDLLANYLLVWEGLKLGQELGYKTFDFEGIYDARFPKDNKSRIGYSQFKSRFHGITVEYPAPFIKIYNPFFKIMYYFMSLFNV